LIANMVGARRRDQIIGIRGGNLRVTGGHAIGGLKEQPGVSQFWSIGDSKRLVTGDGIVISVTKLHLDECNVGRRQQWIQARLIKQPSQ